MKTPFVPARGGRVRTAARRAGAAAVFLAAILGGCIDSVGLSDYPTPVIHGLSPESAEVGGWPWIVTITGEGFAPPTYVRWDGVDRRTRVRSSTQLEIVLTAADLARAADVSVVAVNPAPGGESRPATFRVLDPPPAVRVRPLPVGALGQDRPATVRFQRCDAVDAKPHSCSRD